MIKNLKAIFFDFDGTLVDSERFYFDAWKPILKQHFDINLTYEDWIIHFAGHTLVRNLTTMNTIWGVDTTEEFMWKTTRENYALQDVLSIPLMPYAKELIEGLAKKEIQIGLVTSNFRPNVDKILAHHGLLQYFNLFVTREDVIDPKPQPECYLKALKLSNFTVDEVIAVEDTATGSRAAKEAGLTCVAVTKQSVERDRLNFVDYLFFDLKELGDLLSI